jgi:4-hydroxy-2-oxoheptanedioate aldolase
MIRENKTKRKLLAGETVFGIFITIPQPRLVELCGLAGFDYMIIDAEHSPTDFGVAEEMVRAADLMDLTPIVRVPGHDPKMILRFLDMGAQGVMAPQVNSKADAQRVLDAVKYAPIGRRGLGSGRAAAYGQSIPQEQYVPHANRETMIIAQIEHIDALRALPEILSIEHIDAFEIGLADLSQSLGVPGEQSHPKVQAAADQIVAGVLRAGRVIGDTANDAQTARGFMAKGYRMIDCGLAPLISKMLRGHVAALRAP